MNQLMVLSKQILPWQQKDSLRSPHSNLRAVAFNCSLLSLLIFEGAVAVHAQQPDPLTVTPQGNVGIGATTPANKLTVAGNAGFSGAVGVGTSNLGTSKIKFGGSPSDFAHFRFGYAGAGELEFAGWKNG